MKAVHYYTYGGPDVLVYEDVPRPTPRPDEVLIRVYAAGINPGDRIIRSGLSQNADLRIQFSSIPGFDVSGMIEEVGPNVNTFCVGEEGYGMTLTGGAYAEYAIAPATQLARKPSSLDHIHAAGVPMSAFTAWRSLFIQDNLEAGQTVLANRAAGGVGHFTVQLAKKAGARVIRVASGRHTEFLYNLGVDQCIDYMTTSVENIVQNVDLVVDTVGGEHGYHLLHVLKYGGTLIPVVGGTYTTRNHIRTDVTVQEILFTSVTTTYLTEIGRLIDAGDLRVTIDTVFPLAEARQAHERLERHHARGKQSSVCRNKSLFD